jgi:hypothetical protein
MAFTKKHFENNHQQLWKKLIEWKEKSLKKKKISKKRFGPTLGNIFTFFGSSVAYNKNNPHKFFFQEDLLLLIVKEFMVCKTTIIRTSRLCAKFASLGNCPNCFWYLGAHCPTMHVEPKSVASSPNYFLMPLLPQYHLYVICKWTL